MEHRGVLGGGQPGIKIDLPVSPPDPSRQFSLISTDRSRPGDFSMHRICALTLSLVAATVLAPRPAVAVQFPDKNLEAALRALVFEKKANMDELTDDDLRKISTLEAKGKKIQNLSGLEKCTNLLLLDLENNEVADLNPIKTLVNLQSLNLAGNKIADLTPLMDLNKLQYLELSRNQVKALQPLSAMAKLSALYLAENQIEELAPLAGLANLSSLDVAKNKVANIKPLANIPRLMVLKLSDNSIEDLSPAVAHPPQSMLLVERNKIADLAPLVNAAKADSEGRKDFAPFLRLYLAGNPLSDNAKNEQLAALKGFGVRVENQ
jgi:Leucine-rich repeat (LRR) protein